MKKTALLIDAGWFAKNLATKFTPKVDWPSAEQIRRNAIAALAKDEEIFRIFYYDCEPSSDPITNPIDKVTKNYAAEPPHSTRMQVFRQLGQMDYVALRRGDLMFRDWEVTEKYKKALLKGTVSPLTASDIRPDFRQKGVDMRIGIDVASLSLRRLVERIILFSADTDMIPAMKLARREGVQVFVVKLGSSGPNRALLENADGVRRVTPTA